MPKILNLVIQLRHDSNEPKDFVESFEIREDVENPEKALRDAVQEFLRSNTDESKAARTYANGCFNWGDAIGSVPKALFIKHGLTPVNCDSVDVFVDHDEILIDVAEASLQEKIKSVIKGHIKKGERDIAYWLEGSNMVAEATADSISKGNEKLKLLLTMDEVNAQVINDLIASETDDSLVIIYENILESFVDLEDERSED